MGNPSRRGVLAGAVALALTPAIAKAADEFDPALVAAAKKEGKGTYYGVSDTIVAGAVINGFKARFGIPLEFERLIAGPLLDRINAEAQSGNYVADMMITTDRTQIQTAADKALLIPVDGLPYLHLYPPTDHAQYWAMVAHDPYSVVWNKDEFTEAPTGWKDLVDPKYKGRLLLIDPRIGAGPSQFYALMQQLYGDDFIRQLGRNGQFVTSVVPGLQQIAADSKGIYAPGVHLVIVGLNEKGAHLGELVPEPSVATASYASLLTHAPHPNVARLLLGWMLSPEGQAITNRGSYSSLAGVPGTSPLPALAAIDSTESVKHVKEYAALLGLS